MIQLLLVAVIASGIRCASKLKSFNRDKLG